MKLFSEMFFTRKIYSSVERPRREGNFGRHTIATRPDDRGSPQEATNFRPDSFKKRNENNENAIERIDNFAMRNENANREFNNLTKTDGVGDYCGINF